MQGDDFNKLMTPKVDGDDQKVKDDFDDISSIYTNRLNNNVLEDTMKRVRDRDIALSAMEEQEEFQYFNKQINYLQIDENEEINADIEKKEKGDFSEGEKMTRLKEKHA